MESSSNCVVPKRNLKNYLYRLQHTKLDSDANSTSRSKSSAISISGLDRPTHSNSSVYNQHDLSGWLTRSQGDGEQGELGISNSSYVLGIMWVSRVNVVITMTNHMV